MRRRTFLGSALTGSLALKSQGCRQQSGTQSGFGDIPKRVFGKTEEKLTIIGQAAGRFPLISFEDAKAVTLRAYELGINYFDNAHAYWSGRSEEVYGEVLPAFRDEVFVTTKSADRTREGARKELELSLKRLQMDYVDLWQIHAVGKMDEVDQIFGSGGAIEAFEEAKQSGKCRFIGFTGHRDPKVHIEMLSHYDQFDTILMPLNPADPSYLSFEKDVLPEAVRQGLGIQGMKSLANAKLLPSFSVKNCVDYVLSLPIHCLTMGCTTIGQVEDDVRIARDFARLEEDQMGSLRERAQKLSGPELEDWKRGHDRAQIDLDREDTHG